MRHTGGRNLPFPLLWLLAFTTACTTVQAVIPHTRFIRMNMFCNKWITITITITMINAFRNKYIHVQKKSKPASDDPSIQWKLEIITDLTAIHKPLLIPKCLPAAARNTDSQLWTLPSVARGKNELLRCWQAVCASNCVSREPSVQKQLSISL